VLNFTVIIAYCENLDVRCSWQLSRPPVFTGVTGLRNMSNENRVENYETFT
jgi:hypothetical protein